MGSVSADVTWRTREQRTVVLSAVAARCSHHIETLKDSSTGEVSPIIVESYNGASVMMTCAS